jgi:cobalt-zinc-cadmium efflux system membrane fusion protein
LLRADYARSAHFAIGPRQDCSVTGVNLSEFFGRHFGMTTITQQERTTPGANVAVAPSSPSPVWQWFGRVVPTTAVLTMLAVLAAWGHRNEWTVPKFSALVGGEAAQTEDWCKDHNVPATECIECLPDLVPPVKDYGWCQEHGVAQCPLHHPDLAQVKTIPAITRDMQDRAMRALALKPRPENNSRCTLHLRRIQFASVEAVEKAGVDITIVKELPIIETVVANGEVVYNQNRMAHLSSRVPGTVFRVEKQEGDRVQKGEVLALVDAAEVGRAKGEFLQAMAQLRLDRANLERLRPLTESGAVEKRRLIELEAADQAAQIRLQTAQQSLVNLGLPLQAENLVDLAPEEVSRQIQFLGLPSSLVADLDAASTSSNLLPLRSPLDGVVIDRDVVESEVVDATTVLFAVGDVSRLWLTLNVRQEDAKLVAIGQPVLFRQSGQNETEVRGLVGWISTSADHQTRTVEVRVDLPNDDGKLRANTFGLGRIVLREEPSAIVVPSEAVHWDGACHVVFVRDKNYFEPNAPKFFHVRPVRPGVKDGDTTEIIAGLLPGEVIASKNSTVLAAQLLKSNLGAGCCEVHTK